MSQCNNIMKKYHDENVKLSEAKRTELRKQSESHREFIKDGLVGTKYPKPKYFQWQGSYSMRTLVQRSDNDYDIDDGVYFDEDSLKDVSLDGLRKNINDALKKKGFEKDPVVKEKCIRTFYKDGHHIDVPVYQITEAGDIQLAIAGNKLEDSDPIKVSEWFEAHQKQQENIRAVVRLLKSFCDGIVSGLIVSTLVIEQKNVIGGDLDDALRVAFKAIESRLSVNSDIKHPIMAEQTLAVASDKSIVKFGEELKKAVGYLTPLEDIKCTKEDELKAWNEVFDCRFFFIPEPTKSVKSSVAVPVQHTKPWQQA